MEKRVSVKGVTTAITFRKGAGPTIVCIHGNSLSQRIFGPLFDAPWLKQYPLLTYDLPGHGQSAFPSNPEEVFTMAGYALHLENLIEALGLDEVVLLGFSMGGHIAMEAAGNNIGSITRGLFTLGSPPIHSVDAFPAAFRIFPGGFSLFSEILSDAEIKEIAENIADDDVMKKILEEDIRNTDPQARKYLVEGLFAGKIHSEHDFLRTTEIPCRITFGLKDKMLFHEYINSDIIGKLLGIRLKIIENCEHMPNWAEDPGFRNEFRQFLEDSLV